VSLLIKNSKTKY